jgi:thiol-disulfide isomerase/thioredoxin
MKGLKHMMKKSLFVLGLLLVFINIKASAAQISAGSWKFVLKTSNADVPFIINFKYQNKKLTGVLHNGKEQIPLKDITYDKDLISIPLQTYELSLELTQRTPKFVSGNLVRHNKNPVIKTPIEGHFGFKERYDAPKGKALIDLSGIWALTMKDEKDEQSPAIGTFTQKNHHFSGSILTPTGDYRYIDGQVSGDKFEGASFDGVYNYVLRGTITKGEMTAEVLSSSKTKVSGKIDPKAELPDAYKQTEMKELKFIFPDLKGQSVSLNHAKFLGKPIVVQIFGSWCPNCMDEMNYLIPWYLENSKRGVEIIALAFERSLSFEEATRQLIKVQKKMNVPYAILQAGSTSEDKPAEKLLGIKNFISFPTTIFLDKNHQVVKVHAGFSGPSTGEYFEKWKTEFNQTVDGLLETK